MNNSLKSFTLALIILLILIVGIVSLRNFARENEENSVASKNADLEGDGSEQPAEQEVLGVVATEELRKIQVFMDNNKDGNRGDGEGGCDTCIAKSLVAALQSGNVEPEASKLKLVNISGNGIVNEADLLGSNKVWGFFDDRKLLIPQQNLLLGDATGDFYISAYDVKLIIAGINANLSDIQTTGSKSTYVFSSLVPSLRTAHTNSTDVWVQFIPDMQNPGIYYLAKGKILHDASGQVSGQQDAYYMTINWNYSGSYSSNERTENVSFILL